MALPESESYMDIDIEDINNQTFSLDMGGSRTKVIYTDDKDNTKDGKCRLYFTSFHVLNMDETIKFLKEKIPPNFAKERRTVRVTGVNVHRHKEKLERELHVTLQVYGETEQFGHCLAKLLKKYPPEIVFKPSDREAELRAMKSLMAFAKWQGGPNVGKKKDQAIRHNEQGASNKPAESDKRNTGKVLPVSLNMSEEKSGAVTFPCLLVMMGSGNIFMKVDENGRVHMLNGGPVGGKYFLALARLASGVKDFNEMVALAEKGKNGAVDYCGKDGSIQVEDNTDDDSHFYVTFPADEIIYALGKVQLSEAKPKKEDVLASFFNSYIVSNIQLACLLLKIYDLKRIYFTGGFLAHDYIRKIAEKHIAMRLTSEVMQQKEPIKYGFVKHGDMYGALGCMLTPLSPQHTG